ncbi:ribonuclease R [Chamaesiphon sp. VAR_48_metabat_135_sub]|uniref:ribonuclease catalytic domain-containing protein n=1 Tax=Chamaesiphon sp. VAR_48_metabat_135_sub TaxID=2964699 RepID=UPI00286D478D|nr:ribonuclease R [Chamaesiphon sp. VAR_48_metabat_135_sub]
MEKGTLVEFWHNGERRLAIADRPEGKKHWVAIDSRTQSHTLHPRDITYEVAGISCKQPAEINKFSTEVAPNIDPDNLEVAWEMLVEDGELVDPPTLADLLYSDRTPVLCYAAHVLLSGDKIYFKNKKEDKYEARSRAQVTELQHQATVKEQKEREQQGFIDRVQQQLAGTAVKWEDTDKQRLEVLEKYVLNPDAPPQKLGEYLTALNRSQTQQAVFSLLVELGWWSIHENIHLRRAQTPVHFSHQMQTVAHELLTNPPVDLDLAHRVDLTHHKVYTIDDESTQEIDDGLSLEILPDGREKLWIHIADPTRLLSPEDRFDLEARKRSVTIYLPTGMIPMFPPELATGPMSLRQGQKCCAISFGVILDPTGAVAEYEITTSTIEPTYRLTYEDVEEMLQLGIPGEREIETIAKASKLRTQWRLSQGSININMPESTVKVHGDEVSIELIEDNRARKLVAEMMILAGEVAAKYGQDHNLPLPYRGQPQPELPPEEELILIPVGPARSCAVRRCMPRSEMSTSPSRHAGLGLNTYSQVTSPIRRYTDLISHFQIKAHLRGDELPFTVERLQEIMLGLGTNIYEANMVERQTNRYWTLEYFNRSSEREWDAIFLRWLREDESLALIMIEDLGIELAMKFPRWADIGERIQVQVVLVDPRQDIIHLREIISQSD